MSSIKAIIVGSVFIVVTLLLLQLLYVFLAVGYIELAAIFPFLKNISGLFRYLVGVPVLMITMFAGGFITASIANVHSNIKVLFHCLAVGLTTVGGMMYSALENSNLTITGIVVIVVAISATSAGGYYWLKEFAGRPA